MNQSETEVRAVLEQYFSACFRADIAALKEVFAENAVMNGFLNGMLLEGGPEPFFEDVANNPSLESVGANFVTEIESFSVLGDVASATVTERGWGPMNFRDYMHLLRKDGQWKIVSKTFTTFD